MTPSNPVPVGDERTQFEAWYAADAARQGVEMDGISHLRKGNTYGKDRAMLNGKWEGWQARASCSTVQQVGAEWMPIASAPKDGGEFLACFGWQGNVVQVVKWNALHGFWQSKGEPLIGFATNATHWHPLPPAPKSDGGNGS